MFNKYIVFAIGALFLGGLLLSPVPPFGMDTPINESLPPIVVKEKTLQEKLQTLDSKSRANTKAQEISRELKKAQYQRSKYKIEVVDSNIIEGGIEVFAKVWENGEQVGFGRDGSVEIERFVIINPPVLVPDSKGKIRQRWVDDEGNPQERRLKIDPEEAIIQSIEHTLDVKQQKHNADNIQLGKIGNTTTTVYPDADPESTTVDGFFQTSLGAWNTVHDATTATHNDNTGTDGIVVSSYKDSSNFEIIRSAFLFDTSSIADGDQIDSATLSLYVRAKDNAENDGSDFISIVTSTPASNTDLVDGDYDQVGDAIDNPTEMHDSGQRKDITSISTGAYTDWTFNATGESNISKTGVSKFGAREGHDVLDESPDTNGANKIQAYAAETSGTSQDPKLVVEHSEPVAAVQEKGNIIFFE